jgi:hypothetical protein
MTYFVINFKHDELSDINHAYLCCNGFEGDHRSYKSELTQVDTIITLIGMPDKQPLRYAKMYRVEEETSLAPLVGFYDE